jgi:hypothetical protein
MTRRLVLGILAVAAATWFMAAPPAHAACHNFQMKVTPTEPNEGSGITVVVTRDAGLSPSSVDISSVDGTAKAGQDFPPVKRTMSFGGPDDVSQSFTTDTTDDKAVEGNETFKLHLSNPQGCAVNPNYVVGPDVTITIVDNDSATTTTARPLTALTTSKAGTSTSRGATSTTSTTAGGVPETLGLDTTTPTEQLAVQPANDRGSNAGFIIGGVVALALAGGVGWLVYRSRRGAV